MDEVEKFEYDITCLHASIMFDKFSGSNKEIPEGGGGAESWRHGATSKLGAKVEGLKTQRKRPGIKKDGSRVVSNQ